MRCSLLNRHPRARAGGPPLVSWGAQPSRSSSCRIASSRVQPKDATAREMASTLALAADCDPEEEEEEEDAPPKDAACSLFAARLRTVLMTSFNDGVGF